MTNDKALEAALLPCPFCGSSAQIERSWVPRSGERLAICSNSACVAHHGEQDEQGGWSCETYFNNEAAIAAWNRRAPLSALPGEAEVERLRKLTSPDAEMLSDGYRLTEIIKLNPADALQAMQARAEKAEARAHTASLGWADALNDLEAAEARAEAAEEANKALMDERTSLIETKRQQIEALTSRAEAAEEAENDAKDCFWAIYPKYLEMGGEPIDTEAARSDLAKRAEAAEARVKELEGLIETHGSAKIIRTALKGGSNG